MSQHALYQKGQKLDKSKLRREKFFLGPEHGPGVYVNVRGLTAPESEAHLQSIKDLGDSSRSDTEKKNAGYSLLACCLVDDDGIALFADAADVESNFDVSAADFVKMMDAMNRLSGFDKDRQKN